MKTRVLAKTMILGLFVVLPLVVQTTGASASSSGHGESHVAETEHGGGGHGESHADHSKVSEGHESGHGETTHGGGGHGGEGHVVKVEHGSGHGETPGGHGESHGGHEAAQAGHGENQGEAHGGGHGEETHGGGHGEGHGGGHGAHIYTSETTDTIGYIALGFIFTVVMILPIGIHFENKKHGHH